MKISIIALAVLAPAAYAQNISAYIGSLVQTLTAANLTALAGAAGAIANTSDGMALLASLATGNKTVFAPSDAAFAGVNQSLLSNATLVSQILSYHILNNTYTVNGSAVTPNHTIARSLLNNGIYNLGGGRSAPLVLARNNTNATQFQIIQATSNFSPVAGPIPAANLLVYIIPQVISLPPTIATIATTLFPSLAGVIQSSGLLDPIANSQAVTIFAPNDAAIGAIMSTLGTLNTTQIQTVLANHVINGTAVYSDRLTAANYTSAAGQPFTFMSNATGAYVMSANSTSRIVQSDIIINNGVVHIIDGVLVNAASNPSAASSAYNSATAAATSQEPTAPVTATSSAAPSGSTSKAAGEVLAPLNFLNSFIGGAIGIAGLLLGGGYVLA